MYYKGPFTPCKSERKSENDQRRSTNDQQQMKNIKKAFVNARCEWV